MSEHQTLSPDFSDLDELPTFDQAPNPDTSVFNKERTTEVRTKGELQEVIDPTPSQAIIRKGPSTTKVRKVRDRLREKLAHRTAGVSERSKRKREAFFKISLSEIVREIKDHNLDPDLLVMLGVRFTVLEAMSAGMPWNFIDELGRKGVISAPKQEFNRDASQLPPPQIKLPRIAILQILASSTQSLITCELLKKWGVTYSNSEAQITDITKPKHREIHRELLKLNVIQPT